MWEEDRVVEVLERTEYEWEEKGKECNESLCSHLHC